MVVAVGDTRAGGHRQSPDGTRAAPAREPSISLPSANAGGRRWRSTTARSRRGAAAGRRASDPRGRPGGAARSTAGRPGTTRRCPRRPRQTRKRFENPEQGDDLQSVLVFLGEVGGTGDGIERQRPAPTCGRPRERRSSWRPHGRTPTASGTSCRRGTRWNARTASGWPAPTIAGTRTATARSGRSGGWRGRRPPPRPDAAGTDWERCRRRRRGGRRTGRGPPPLRTPAPRGARRSVGAAPWSRWRGPT